MIKYQVRSRQLIDIVNDLKDKKIILSPYFQRKLVWRDVHKVDFIKTILMGLPFPEIFIAKGDLDIDKMISTSCIVDGQQRLNSICEYIEGKYSVEGKEYTDLDIIEKEQFLKYEIAIIELDMKHDDSQIPEIFKRLNRTYYSLSNIEKISSEYAASEFMLVAKLLCKELDEINTDKSNSGELDFDLKNNPNISQEFITWAKTMKVESVNKLILESEVFSPYEISRQVHLNYTINILGVIKFGFFNRNLDKSLLEQYAQEFIDKEDIIKKLEMVARKILKMKFAKNTIWINKANMFSLIIALFNEWDKVDAIQEKILKEKLKEFEENLPIEYSIAAKEGVNNKKERLIRNDYINTILNSI